MAKATWKCHTCDETMKCTGRNRAEADRIADWHESQCHTCKDCQVKERNDQADKLMADSVEAGFPQLIGTESQQRWAVTIRADKLVSIDSAVSDISKDHALYGYLIQAADSLQNKSDAHWWIENRDKAVDQLLQSLAKQLADQAKPLSFECELSAASTITPKSSRFNTPAEITRHPDAISIHFPIKDEAVREILIGLNCYWNATHWQCDLNETTGNPSDRVAELGHHLLNERVPVLIWDEVTRQNAVSGNYTALKTQWVVNLPDKKRFGIRWNRWRDTDWYSTVKTIRTSRWSKPYVTVAYTEFEEVQGFAEVNGFDITQGAQEMFAKMENTKLQSLIEEVSPVKQESLPDAERVALEVQDSCVVDASLMDD